MSKLFFLSLNLIHNLPTPLHSLNGSSALPRERMHADRGQTVKRIDLMAGARPHFMKIASILDALKGAKVRGGPLPFRLIHTGQALIVEL